MFPKVLDVLRMRQILLLGVFVMILLEMMNLVLILVIPVMSRTVTEVWEADPVRSPGEELLAGDESTLR